MLAASRSGRLAPRRRQPCPRARRTLLTLAIETSCDDTSVAIVEKRHASSADHGAAAVLHFHDKVTANNLAFKGIHPIVALESHQENLAKLVRNATRCLSATKPDFVTVTRGPGMRSNLATGIDTAKGLAVAWDVPLLGVNHMQAHALTPRLVSALAHPTSHPASPGYPFLSLLVSGGHTMLLESRSLAHHALLAQTRDIAAGDAIDKIARHVLPAEVLAASTSTMYGPVLEAFAFPGGAADHEYAPPASRLMQLERPRSKWGWRFTVPFSNGRGGLKVNAMEYTFSGICSGVEKIVNGKSEEAMSIEERRALAKEAMLLAFEHMASRVVLALNRASSESAAPPTTLVVSGGVAANQFLKTVLRKYLDGAGHADVELVFPPLELCTDNAAMIGWTGIEMFEAGWQSDLGIQALRKWSLDPSADDGGIFGASGWIESKNHNT